MNNDRRWFLIETAQFINQTLLQLTAHTNVALNSEVTPIHIRQAVYHCAPFISFPKVFSAVDVIIKVCKSRKYRSS